MLRPADLLPPKRLLNAPLGPRPSPDAPGVCYSALRRLPRRDFHPLEKNSVTQTVAPLRRHDAPCGSRYGPPGRSARDIVGFGTSSGGPNRRGVVLSSDVHRLRLSSWIRRSA